MSSSDVIELPGQPGKYARRALVDAWRAAGAPPVNSAGRLYAEQKRLFDGWRAGRPGYNPADNPDAPSLPLAHVRFVALDIDATPDRVRRLSAAGLVRPYSYEPWHWQLPGDVRRFTLVTSIPAPAAVTPKPTPATTVPEEDNTMRFIYCKDSGGNLWTLLNTVTGKTIQTREQTVANGWATVWGSARVVPVQELLNALDAVKKTLA